MISLKDTQNVHEPWTNAEVNFLVFKDRNHECWFQDSKWYFKHGNAPQVNAYGSINFAVTLPDQSLLTDDRNRKLLLTAKCFVWARLNPGPWRQANGAFGTARLSFSYFLQVVRFMFENGYQRLSEIDREFVHDFVAHMRRIRIRAAGLNERTVKAEISVLSHLYEERSRLPSYDRMSSPPWILKPPLGRGAGTIKTTRPLSEANLRALLTDAEEWIERRSPDIVRAVAEYRALRPLLRRRANRGEIIRKWAQEFEFSKTQDRRPWRAPLGGAIDVRRMHAKLMIVCLSTIGVLVGQRVHEIVGLGLKETVVETLSPDRTHEIYFFRGITTKLSNRRSGHAHRWVAGARPVGSSTRVLAVRAYEVLQELAKAYPPRAPYAFASPWSGVPLSPTSAWKYLKVHLASVPGLDLKLEKVGTREFRKTFTRFVSRYDTGNLTGVLSQIAHVGVSGAHAYIDDLHMREIISEERRSATADVLYEIASAPVLAGERGKAIQKVGNLAAFRAQFCDRDEFVEKVSVMLKVEGIRLFASFWGICYYHEKEAACGGGQHGPNFANREFGICCECANYIAAETHLPWLKVQLKLNQEFLDEYEVDPESWTPRIVNPNSGERSPCRRNVASTVPSSKPRSGLMP